MKAVHIFCDESDDKGPIFSNFYGGILIRDQHLANVRGILQGFKDTNGITGEMKWSKINKQNFEQYIGFTEKIFDFIDSDTIKARILFTENKKTPISVVQYEPEFRFTRLYYQFIKHSFGLKYCNRGNPQPVMVHIGFDNLPINSNQKHVFKDFITAIPQLADFYEANVIIKRENIREYESHEEVLAQAVDLILGGVQFRLNKKHAARDPATGKIGLKTKAKIKVYEYLAQRMGRTRRFFNLGISTGLDLDHTNKWKHSYRHWNFKAGERA